MVELSADLKALKERRDYLQEIRGQLIDTTVRVNDELFPILREIADREKVEIPRNPLARSDAQKAMSRCPRCGDQLEAK